VPVLHQQAAHHCRAASSNWALVCAPHCAFHYRADGLRIRHSLQGNFPTVFPLLPQLVLLQMDNNRFK